MNYRDVSKIIIIFVLLVVLAVNTLSVQANSALPGQETGASKNFCISEIPIVSSFPSVSLLFRAFDQDLRPIGDISEDGLRISENGETAAPLSSKMQVNSSGLGLDIYIVTDRGNRTNQSSVKSLLSTFQNYDDAKDQITIYTDQGNMANTYLTPSTGVSFESAINDYPTNRTGSYYTVNSTVSRAVSDINASSNECQKAKFLFLIMGDEAVESAENLSDFVVNAKATGTVLVFFHVPTEDGNLQYEATYRSYIEKNGGIYVNVMQNGTDIFANLFSKYRQAYSVSYQSTSSASGKRVIGIVYGGENVPTGGNNFYQIDLLPPQVNLVIPSTTIERTAIEVVEKGYKYDKTSDIAYVQVTFPDEFNRNITSIILIIKQTEQPELRIPVEITSSTGNTYQVNWNLGDLGDSNRADLSIGTEVVDELGMSARNTVDVPVIVLSHVPMNLLAQRYLIYLLIFVVVIMMVIMIVMRRRMAQLMSGAGAKLSAAVEGVRKTLVGGGMRGKPLAILKVVDGPANMVGEELKVYTEKISIGRDPRQADYTFYGSDANSSVSGLHAILERVNGGWRIVAVSQSRSETFVDNTAIAFNVPFNLNPGQQVRLGYPAQQPAVFEFQIPNSDSTKSSDAKKTDVGADKTVPIGLIKIDKKDEEKLKKQASEGKESLFNKYK